MKALITGANGFIGRSVTTALYHQSWQVVPAVREKAEHSLEVRVGEIDGATRWKNALHDCDTVIHLAARVHVMQDKSPTPLVEFRKTNVDGTLNLARQAAEAGVKRFLFLSSIKVNGEGRHETNPLSGKRHSGYVETDPPSPEDPYALSKWEAEQALMTVACETGMEVVIIRPPLVYGPGVKGNFALLAKCLKKRIPLPFGAVNNKRSLIALDNLVDFIVLCADRQKSPRAANQLFLISDDKDVSTAELLRKMGEAYGVTARLLPVPASWLQLCFRLLGRRAWADRLLGPLQVNGSKARELLGWKPVTTMEEQLQKMAKHDSAL